MTNEREAWIIDGVRTPRGKGKPSGALHPVHPQELLAQCLNALVQRTGVQISAIDDVVVGSIGSIGDHGHCIGRLSVLSAGWPWSTPAITLHRFCASGQSAVAFGAMGVRSGMQQLVVAGGVESMSRWIFEEGDTLTLDGSNPALRERYETVPQGISADLIASIEGFTREVCDQYAATSQTRADTAVSEGRFAASIIPIALPDGTIALDRDEHPRPGTTMASLASLPVSFEAMGSHVFPGYPSTFDEMCMRTYPQVESIRHVHHAGNSSAIVDGAAALLIASSDFARSNRLTPRARIVTSTVLGSEPVVMLTAPTPASERALALAGMQISDIDLWEINEAFAAVPLKVQRDLDLDPSTVNINGGAIALGHPIGATGCILIETALDELERSDLSTALITMCTGAGMGTATIIERM
jgi:acetyl-CoA C-acetyltransferase